MNKPGARPNAQHNRKPEAAPEPLDIVQTVAALSGDDPSAALSALCAAAKRPSARAQIDALLGGRDLLLSLLSSENAKARKNAARLIGALSHPEDAPALSEALLREQTRFVTPSLLLSLGSVGGEEAKRALVAFVPPSPADETEEKHCREIAEAHKKALDACAPARVLSPYRLTGKRPVLLTAPEGFCDVLLDELQQLGYAPEPAPQDGINGCLVAVDRLEPLYRARCFTEALLPLASRLPLDVRAIADAARGELTQPFRIELRGYAGDRAALIRALSAALGGGDAPSHYGLELRVVCRDETCSVDLRPASVPDERFSYRRRAIPASIKPSLAACIARACAAGLRAERVRVLDPFCGSGTMLFECERAMPAKSLLGVDVAASALSAARENGAAAHSRAVFVQKDILRFTARDPFELIVSNMPFGNRVGSHAENETLYFGFAAMLPKLLADGGLAALYTTEHRLLEASLAKASGLTVEKRIRTEAGGLTPTLYLIRR